MRPSDQGLLSSKCFCMSALSLSHTHTHIRTCCLAFRIVSLAWFVSKRTLPRTRRRAISANFEILTLPSADQTSVYTSQSHYWSFPSLSFFLFLSCFLSCLLVVNLFVASTCGRWLTLCLCPKTLVAC